MTVCQYSCVWCDVKVASNGMRKIWKIARFPPSIEGHAVSAIESFVRNEVVVVHKLKVSVSVVSSKDKRSRRD